MHSSLLACSKFLKTFWWEVFSVSSSAAVLSACGSGPSRHNLFTSSSSGVDYVGTDQGMSAGFSRPDKSPQHSTGSRFWISETLFCMNGFHTFSALQIQHRATLESVKQWKKEIFNSGVRLDLTVSISHASKTAERSSSLGTDCFFMGATLVWGHYKLLLDNTFGHYKLPVDNICG